MKPATARATACSCSIAIAALLWALPASAERVKVEIEGIEGDMLESARASVQLREYEDRDVSAAEIKRLFQLADDEIREALQPFGYYNADVDARLEQPDPQAKEPVYRAAFKVNPGDPVIVREAHIDVGQEPAQLDTVRQVLGQFKPRVGARLDHGEYERSKQELTTAIANEGFLDAKLERHRVEVVLSANSARIDLAWNPGPRYKLGPLHFSDAQFPQEFLQRYTPWKQGEFYSAEKLLTLQQTLVDADYFSSVAVAPDLEHKADGVVPVDVVLIPAKRSVYTASLYVSTDSGPGGRVGFERRWLNQRGHKFKAQAEYSPRLKEISTNYTIPHPGIRNRKLNFGVGYRDEQTDTSSSRMLRVAGNEVMDRWRGFTRTLGLQYLNGDFEIADEQHTTSLLYAEGLLTRKDMDDLYFPLEGYSLLYGLRVAAKSVLSEASLIQVRAEGKWLHQVGEDGRFIARATLGAMAVDDFDALPPELRFFAGGDRSIRGFDYQQIGEQNAQGKVIGGEHLAAASAEYEHYFLNNWGMAAFVDAGDAFKSNPNLNLSAGIGLRWKSPVGMLRLDVARPFVSEFEHKWRIHLVIGPDL